MTYREYYAGLAMQGLSSGGYSTWEDLTTDSNNLAIAMCKSLEVDPNQNINPIEDIR